MHRLETFEARERLAATSKQRGFPRKIVIALVLAGGVPALLLTIIRRPGYEDAIPIAALFLIGPAALLLLWTSLDREGQAARELVMWLRAVSRASSDSEDAPIDSVPSPSESALSTLSAEASDSVEQTATAVRAALAPLVLSPRSLAVRIFVYRFWYPVLWIVFALPLVAVVGAAISLTPP